MESLKDQLVQEIDRTPASLLPEVLDFLLFINQKHQQDKLEILAFSESSLQKDWLQPEEDDAWQHL
jgi:hypothetical protein